MNASSSEQSIPLQYRDYRGLNRTAFRRSCITHRLALPGFRTSSIVSCSSKRCGECCLPQAGNILHTVHTSCHPTLQHHNSYDWTDNHRQWNAVGSTDDGHKDSRNLLRSTINHHLLHLVGLTLIYLSKMNGHSNIKFKILKKNKDV